MSLCCGVDLALRTSCFTRMFIFRTESTEAKAAIDVQSVQKVNGAYVVAVICNDKIVPYLYIQIRKMAYSVCHKRKTKEKSTSSMGIEPITPPPKIYLSHFLTVFSV